jgi:hypothetical protein
LISMNISALNTLNDLLYRDVINMIHMVIVQKMLQMRLPILCLYCIVHLSSCPY